MCSVNIFLTRILELLGPDTILFLLVWLLKQLGANGYIFAIDANGYLLLHPNLQPKVMRVVTKM